MANGPGAAAYVPHAENRRAQYRVNPQTPNALRLALKYGDEQYLSGEIADVSCRGASVRLTKNDVAKLNHGDDVEVAITSSELGSDIVVG